MGAYDLTYNHKVNIWIHIPFLMIHYEHQKLFVKWLGSRIFLTKIWYNYNFFPRKYRPFICPQRDIYSLPNLSDVEQVSNKSSFGLWIS